MERTKYYDRDDDFTYEEKASIAKKSDDKCCHCGKIKYQGYGATIDHFIPLSKGGSNRDLNLIMMCEECNKEKSNKIVDIAYVPHLKDKYKNQLNQYLESYIHAFSFTARDRILALDEYSLLVINPINNKLYQSHRKQKAKIRPVGTKYLLKRATDDDFDRLCDYFEKYLKKYNQCDGRKAVENNIGFWLQWGCIYYIERNKEIQIMTVMTIRHMPWALRYSDEIQNALQMYIFSYYATDTAFSIVRNIITKFPSFIIDEQGINNVPTCAKMLCDDKLTSSVILSLQSEGKHVEHLSTDTFTTLIYNVVSEDRSDMTPEEKAIHDSATITYFKQFEDIEGALIDFAQDPSSMWYGWMFYDILSCEDIRDSHIFDNDEIMKKNNEYQLLMFSKQESKGDDKL